MTCPACTRAQELGMNPALCDIHLSEQRKADAATCQEQLAALARVNAAYNTEDDSHDLTVKDYDLLERRYKHADWRDQNQMDFELGWEAAVTHLRKLLRG